MIDIQAFIKLLESKAKRWSEVGGNVGLRVIKLNGSIVRAAVENELTEDWLDRLFAQLPKDACLMDAGHAIMWMDCESGAAYDRYSLVVGSKEWPVLKEGEPIPELLPVFYKNEPHRDTVQPTIMLPPMVQGQTYWLLGSEKGMYWRVDKYGLLEPCNSRSVWSCSRHVTPVPDIAKGAKCPVCVGGTNESFLNMKEINGEKVLWFNHYLAMAITTKDCERCGGDLNIYGTANGAKLLFSECNIEWAEMLPTIIEFVAEQKRKDEES